MSDEPTVEAEDLARTYDGGRTTDAWEAVEQYRDAMEYRSRHPNGIKRDGKRTRYARGRIRTWLDDGQPDAARAIDVAHQTEWIEIKYDHSNFEPLNALVSNVLSNGSIAVQHYQPAFVLDPTRRQLHFVDALDAIGLRTNSV